ncbi:MAG: hypothetical protein SGJ10_10040 [Bacteroidota bacterium]|nr:hypothetical protein [Bacteroidota bacterium]
MIQKLSILFWLNKSKANSIGFAPIMWRITIDGVRSGNYSTGKRINSQGWDNKKQRATCVIVNGKIKQIEHDLDKKYLELYNTNGSVDVFTLCDYYNKKTDINPSLQNVCEAYFMHLQDMGEKKKMASGTVRKYKNYYNNIASYLINAHSHIAAEQFDLKQADLMDAHIKKGKGCQQLNVNKILQFVFNSLAHARGLGRISKNPLTGLCFAPIAAKKPTFLTSIEIAMIQNHKFASTRLQHVADMFLWQCHTGQSFLDFANYHNNTRPLS